MKKGQRTKCLMLSAGILTLADCSVLAAVRINEISAGSSSHLQQFIATNVYQVGAGTMWQAPAFNDANWISAAGPYGFGSSFTNGTNLTASMRYAAMSLYVRSAFTADTSVATGSLQVALSCDFNDGFLAFLNGREVVRKNLGAVGSFVYCDQASFNIHTMGTNSSYVLGIASNLLVAGTNYLCVQIHNDSFAGGTFGWSGQLEANDGISTQVLFAATNRSRILVGYGEPSGGISTLATNAALTTTGREWTPASFDDTGWPQGPGGIGYGYTNAGTDVHDQMYGITPSLYMRQVFNVASNVQAMTNRLKFIVGYDDGYIAYLNGSEISRANMGNTGEFIGFDMNATASHKATPPVTNTLAACSNLLVVGTNVLAIQVATATSSTDMMMSADLVVSAATNITLVNHTNLWHYLIGLEPPVPEADADAVSSIAEFCDWVELFNDATTNISLSGWSLTDSDGEPRKWWFPNGAMIPAQGFLVVLCSGASGLASSSGPPYQTSFKLDKAGEYLGLYDVAGNAVSAFTPKYPKQSIFHSYGWSTGLAANAYWTMPSPGAANFGTILTNIVEDPDFDLQAGFYTNSITVHLTCATTNSTILYTLDGSEPRTNNGTLYTSAGISVTTSKAIRARAFLSRCIPSQTKTHTYLANLPSALRTLTVVSLAGDPTQGYFKSNGVTSIIGGNYTSGTWAANSPDDFDIPVMHGRPYERPTSVEFMEPGTTGSVYRADCGVRVAGSSYTRPRYTLQSMSAAWNGPCESNKPQFNLYFRSDYGDSPYQFPFISGSRVDHFETIRLRSGHNDYSTPFIRDELARRLLNDTGQVSSRGRMASLFVNGIFRCYYNPAERLDEKFFQEWYRSTNQWDIINNAGITEGDSVAYNTMMTLARTLNCSVLTNYQRLTSMIDPVNFADYLMVNIYGATWDWPGNNYYTARERASNALFRFHIWDAEGAFSNSAGKSNDYDTVGRDLLLTNNTLAICTLFCSLYKSPEFKLLFADRFQKHVVHGPALSTSNALARMWELKNEIDPVMFFVRGSYMSTTIFTNWFPTRPGFMIQHFRTYGLLPALAAPDFSSPGGTVTNGSQISLINTNGGGQIYYALDGADPRAPGGAIAGALYTAPVTIDRSRQIKARCFDGATWSAVQEETYLSTMPPIVITEIMYNPDSSGAEFVELFNAGTSPVDMSGFYFSKGVTFDFAGSTVSNLAPGEYCVVVQNPAFTQRYGTNGIRVAGNFSGKLDNAGETLELSHHAFGVIATIDYSDSWFPLTDGQGFSLNARDATTQASLLSVKSSWRSSSRYGGTPGGPDGGEVPLPGSVVINEILTHTDASPDGDWIELYNTTADPIPVGGWWLSDNKNTPYKFQLPSNTALGAYGYLVFSASNDFQNATNAAVPFGLSEFGDEDVVLSSALDDQGHPTGYQETQPFTAQEREVPFGRYIKSTGKADFIALREATRGAANAGPRIGPLVITEIQYAPATNKPEFIELYNITTAPLPLYETNNTPWRTWQLADAITYTFPTGIVIAPLSALVVCSTNPAAFCAQYPAATNIPVFGPWTGQLDNAGETLRLLRPLEQDITYFPTAVVEVIDYKPDAPWPVPPTNGYSIQRIAYAAYCNEPLNWRLGPTNGAPGPLPAADSDNDGIPDRWETAHNLDHQNSADATSDRDGDHMTALQEFIAGTDPDNSNDCFRVQTTGATNALPTVSFARHSPTGTGYETYNRFYALDASTDLLTTNWTPPPTCTNIPAADAPFTYTPAATNPLVYRARVWLTPK